MTFRTRRGVRGYNWYCGYRDCFVGNAALRPPASPLRDSVSCVSPRVSRRIAAGVNPLWHCETVGWKEGRDPSAGFDTLKYLAANPDVAAAQVNPLDHFLKSGIYEGRSAMGDGIWH